MDYLFMICKEILLIKFGLVQQETKFIRVVYIL